jgi:hypothetical protein
VTLVRVALLVGTPAIVAMLVLRASIAKASFKNAVEFDVETVKLPVTST